MTKTDDGGFEETFGIPFDEFKALTLTLANQMQSLDDRARRPTS